MKRLFVIAIVAAGFAACNDNVSDNKSIGSPGSAETENQAAPVAYTPDDGDVTYRDGKLMVRRNGDWKVETDEVKLDNGAVVYTDGRVKKDDKEITLQDGEVINEEGNVFDKAGYAIESAWKDTKEGVKEAGKEIEKGAKKAGDKVEDAVDHDHDNHDNK